MENIEQYGRFKDAVWFNKNTSETVLVGGAGGIGSWLTFFLSRAGFNPFVYDFDKIETHNLGGQLFRTQDVNKYKVTALDQIIKEYCGNEINTSKNAINLQSPTHHFIFSAFDNMKARKDLFNVWKKSLNLPIQSIFIDGRLTLEQIQIFCVTKDNMDKYEKEYLFDDADVPDAPCTLKQTSHSAAMIASLMLSFFTNHIGNIYERNNSRYVPFFYEFYIPLVQTDIL